MKLPWGDNGRSLNDPENIDISGSINDKNHLRYDPVSVAGVAAGAGHGRMGGAFADLHMIRNSFFSGFGGGAPRAGAPPCRLAGARAKQGDDLRLDTQHQASTKGCSGQEA